MAAFKHPAISKRELFAASKYNQRSTLDFTMKGLYGPKAQLRDDGSSRNAEKEDPSCEYHLHWSDDVSMILLMKKFKDREVTEKFKIVSRWIIENRGIKVVCEPSVLEEDLIKQDDFKDIAGQLITWEDGTRKDCLEEIDLIVCIGGDGTLLYTSSLFQERIPPIISFHMGSLGFLTPFRLDTFEESLTRVLEKNVSLTLRHRLVCEIKQQTQLKINNDDAELCPLSPTGFTLPTSTCREKFVVIQSGERKQKMLVMNELVVDRGPSPYITNLEVICNDRLVTTVQGDGIIIATPTGSTAYSLAAGSSMVHPSVPCMVMTPICPHSLSFRSIVIPAGVEITIRIPIESRSSAFVAFDGRNRQELFQGDSVVVNTSPWPIPSINNTGHVTDWFDSLAECLQWNVRKQQKAFK